jgi:coenzyme F420-reducing hydrogenase delta subunit/ferredoxin
MKIIRVMCTGRVDPEFILRAFSNGTDGVFIGGCWLGECKYVTEGNYDSLSMMHLFRKILEHIGVNPERLRLEWISAAEGIRFAEVMEDFSRKLKKLGPLGTGEGEGQGEGEREDAGTYENELKSRLEEVTKLIPYIKMAKSEKLALRLEKEEEYNELFTSDEVAKLFDEVASYHIDPDKCQACMICKRRCPVEAIEGAKKQIHVIDQEKCIKCGTCLEVCPPRFDAVNKIQSPVLAG